jgi:excisionase family DNA binding protein
MKTPEAARYTGLAKSTLEKMRVRGDGCGFIRIGRAILYDADDLDAWLAAHRRKSTSDHGER